MNQVTTEQVGQRISWKDNPPIQKLLDVIVSILAEEYIQTAKQNPEVFLREIASQPSAVRNDREKISNNER
jgi:hypothetical protein